MRPLKLLHGRDEVLETAGVLRDEVDVNCAFAAAGLRLVVHGEERLRHAHERCQIAAGKKLVILRADLRFLERQHLHRRLWVRETLEPTLAQRIERDDGHSAIADALKLMQHPRAVHAYILTEEQNALGLREIIELHGANRHTNRLRQRH